MFPFNDKECNLSSQDCIGVSNQKYMLYWVYSQSNVEISLTLTSLHISGWKFYFNIDILGFVSSKSVPEVTIQAQIFIWKRNLGNTEKAVRM